jgi:hypothetical protein
MLLLRTSANHEWVLKRMRNVELTSLYIVLMALQDDDEAHLEVTHKFRVPMQYQRPESKRYFLPKHSHQSHRPSPTTKHSSS